MSIAGPANEKYRLQKLLPEFAMYPKTDVLAKTSAYFSGNDNRWNRKAHASKKFYNQYHKGNDDHLSNLQKIQEKIENDRLMEQQMHTSSVVENRYEARQRLEERKMERIALQMESQQTLSGDIGNDNLADSLISDPATTQRLVNRKTLNSMSSQKGAKTFHSWNNHLAMSKKNLEFVMTPAAIENDQQAVQLIANRIAQTDRVEDLRREVFSKKHDEIHRKFRERHNQNLANEAKVGLIPALHSRGSYEEVKSTSEIFLTKYNPLRSAEENSCTTRIRSLSRPKTHASSKQMYPNSEYRGLYFADLEPAVVNLNTNYAQTLLKNAPAHTTLDFLQTRPTTRCVNRSISRATLPTQSHVRFNSLGNEDPGELNSKEATVKALDEFMRVNLAKEIRRVGYPRIALMDVQSYTNPEELKLLKFGSTH